MHKTVTQWLVDDRNSVMRYGESTVTCTRELGAYSLSSRRNRRSNCTGIFCAKLALPISLFYLCSIFLSFSIGFASLSVRFLSFLCASENDNNGPTDRVLLHAHSTFYSIHWFSKHKHIHTHDNRQLEIH